MPVIDAQVHAYERDRPERPWAAVLHGPPEVTGADMVAAMDAVGVDGALLVSPWTMYRFDASYAEEVYRDFPDRFGLIKPIDPRSASAAEEVAAWAQAPGTVGVRLMIARAGAEADLSGYLQVMAAAARHGLPVNVLCWGHLDVMAALAAANDEVQLVIDHLGLQQPFEPPVPDAPFAELDDVLALARFDHVAIKVTGACTLSHEPFPFADIWPHLERVFDAFGLERCLWGTDWTRATELLTYGEAVDAFTRYPGLSDTDRAMLMGGALERIYHWQPGAGPAGVAGSAP